MADVPPTPGPAPDHPLAALGWRPELEPLFAPHQAAGFELARVAVQDKHHYLVCTAREELIAHITGKVIHEAAHDGDLPKVGDWVAVSLPLGESKAVIHHVLPRRTKLSRKVPGPRVLEQVLATNMDVVFVVQALDSSFDPRKFERYLTIVHASGAQPVVVLNKSDVCPDMGRPLARARAVAGDAPVATVSAQTGHHLEELRQWIQPGVTVVFIGPSGVGKSSLINRLYGEEIQHTIEVRESDAKGRHATSRRELIVLPGGGLLIDTPGLRECQLWTEEQGPGLADAFGDVEELALQCHFSGCSHTQEARCAVLAAVADGRLSRARHRNFLKLRDERAQLATARNTAAQIVRKRQTQAAQRAFQKRKHGDYEEPE